MKDYNSKYEMEVSADEQSPPASQIQPRHEAHDKNKQKNSLPQTSAENKNQAGNVNIWTQSL